MHILYSASIWQASPQLNLWSCPVFDMKLRRTSDEQHVAANAQPAETCTITFPNIAHLSTSLSHAQ